VIQVTGLSLLVVGLAARKNVVVRDTAQQRGAVPEITIGLRSAAARWSF
jgi:hypothetical protein